MLLTTKENIKQLLGIKPEQSSDDVLLASIALAVSGHCERFMFREAEIKERTQYFDVRNGRKIFHLKAYPVSACTVYNDADREFTTALDAANYTFFGDAGELIIDGITLSSGYKVLKVVYTGGLAADQDSLQASYPDIEMAARIQGAYWFEKRKKLGVSSESFQGGAVRHESKLQLLPTVKEALLKYRKVIHA